MMTFARGVRMSGDEETHMANMSNDVLSVAGGAGCTG